VAAKSAGQKSWLKLQSVWLRLSAYAAPALPLALLTLPFYIVVPATYVEIGAPIAAVGIVLLLIRIMDAVTDPLMGVIADKTRSVFGRKAWFACGVPLTALSAAMLFLPPQPMTGVGYLALWATLLSLGWTMVIVPYSAWGAELSSDYEGRSRVAAFRETAVFIGTLVALVVPEIVRQSGVDLKRVNIETLELFAYGIGLGLPLLALLAFVITPEPKDRSTKTLPILAGFKAMAENGPFLRLIVAFLFNGLANGLPATLFLFFINDRLQLSESAGIFLIVYFGAGLAGVPLWLWLARRKSKQFAWAMGMSLAVLGFLAAPFLPPGAFIGFLLVCIVTGLAVGADLTMPPSIQADVIELDTARSGAERSATYMAAWSLATKLSLALAVGIAFPVLAASGYDPSNNIRTESGIFMLALLYAALPIVLKLIAIVLVSGLPLNRTQQEEAAAQIAAQKIRVASR
jgi:glycoside/pentoside/hexuronide:cation symporter, GPH family